VICSFHGRVVSGLDNFSIYELHGKFIFPLSQINLSLMDPRVM